MAVTFIGLLGLILLLGLAAGAAALVAALLGNPAARKVLLGLVAVPAVAAVAYYLLQTGELTAPTPPGVTVVSSTSTTLVTPTLVAPTPPSAPMSIRAWSGVAMALTMLAAAYLMLRLANSPRGFATPAVLGAAGLGLLLLLLFLNVASQPRRGPAPEGEPSLTATQAWEELTRPRIHLSDDAAVIRLRTPKREETMPANLADEELVSQIARLQATLGAGERLEVELAGQTLSFRGRTSRERVEQMVADARVLASAPAAIPEGDAAPDEPVYSVTVNNRALTFSTATPVEDVARDIRRAFLENDRNVQIDTPAGELTYTGRFIDATVIKLLGAVRGEALRAAQDAAPSDQPTDAADAEAAVSDEEASDSPDQAAPADTPAEEGAANADTTTENAEPAADAPAELPDWVSRPQKRIGDIYRQVIQTDPYFTADECYADFMARLREVVSKYAESQLGIAGVDIAPSTGLTPAELAAMVSTEEHLQQIEGSFGPMQRLHVQVEFDQEFRDLLKRTHTHWQRRSAVRDLTAGGACVLLLIGGVLGLIKLDEATKGYYSKWLFVGVPAAIIVGLLLLGSLEAMGVSL